jgi:predicted DNA-binding protein (UPF0251 family)
MPRPRRCRWIEAEPNSTYFKPRGIPLTYLEEVVLTVDEHEALRLADLMGLEQEEAAKKMKISRQTFGRMLASARKKIADAIINAKAIRIEGGDFVMVGGALRCGECNYIWQLPEPAPESIICPSCGSPNLYPADRYFNRGWRRGRRGWGRGRGQGGGFGRGST